MTEPRDILLALRAVQALEGIYWNLWCFNIWMFFVGVSLVIITLNRKT